MSWGVNAIGKPEAVAAKIAANMNQSKCVDPEEGVKQAAGAAIAAALAAQDSVSVVKVVANGHQSDIYLDGKKAGIQNTLNISIEPIYGFVE